MNQRWNTGVDEGADPLRRCVEWGQRGGEVVLVVVVVVVFVGSDGGRPSIEGGKLLDKNDDARLLLHRSPGRSTE